MISLRNIEKYFEHGPTKTYVLRRINVDIKEGEFISIMGPSGAGKSTLLHLLGMHDSAWTGEYNFLDHPIHKLNKKDRSELYKNYIGFVFQSYHLLDSLTVYENLDIPLSYRNIKKVGARRASSATRSTASTWSARKICIRTSSRAASSNWWPSRAP